MNKFKYFLLISLVICLVSCSNKNDSPDQMIIVKKTPIAPTDKSKLITNGKWSYRRKTHVDGFIKLEGLNLLTKEYEFQNIDSCKNQIYDIGDTIEIYNWRK